MPSVFSLPMLLLEGLQTGPPSASTSTSSSIQSKNIHSQREGQLCMLVSLLQAELSCCLHWVGALLPKASEEGSMGGAQGVHGEGSTGAGPKKGGCSGGLPEDNIESLLRQLF